MATANSPPRCPLEAEANSSACAGPGRNGIDSEPDMKKRFNPLRRAARFLAALSLGLFPLTGAFAHVHPTHRPDVPDFDKRAPVAQKVERVAERENGKAHLNSQLPFTAAGFQPF